MHPRQFALYGGILMLLLGLVALIPQFVGSAATLPPLVVNTSYGLFMGLFPMNIFNKIALIVFGLGGIAAYSQKTTALPASIWYSRIVFVVMGIAALLGLFPATNTLYGYWPLFGGEVLLHGVFAVLGAYFGFALSTKAHNELDKKPWMHTPTGSMQ